MKLWLPYVECGSGADVYVHSLATALAPLGVEPVPEAFDHRFQYAPWALRRRTPPAGTDLVLANSWNAFAFKRRGIPLVVAELHCIFDPIQIRLRTPAQAVFHELMVKRFEMSGFRAADAVVTISDYTARSLKSALGVTASDVVLNGIDTDFFSPATRPAAGHPGNARRSVLFVGNASARKGADLLPGIMQRLGDGVELRYTAGLRERSILDSLPRARPLGRLSAEALRDAYRAADLLLFPTRLEGFGYAAAESLACATPVVTSDASSLPEVVRHGETGLLCPPGDVDAFANAVESLLGDPDRLARLAANARADAVACFGLDRMGRAYRAIFERLLG